MPDDKRPLAIAALAVVGGAVVAYKLSRPKQSTVTLVPPTQVTQIPQSSGSPSTLPTAVPLQNTQASGLPNFTVFPFSRLQYAVIPPASIATVFLGQVPSSYAAIIQYVGNTYPLAFDAAGNPAVTLRWTLDGDLVEDVQRIIADPNSPKQLDPPYMATRELRVTGINTHPTLSVNVAFLMDGFMRRRTDMQ